MTQCLDLTQPNLNQPYVLRCDARYFAIGASLLQEFEGKESPVGFFSQTLGKLQLNLAPKEKEIYTIVVALLKWSALINFQHRILCTDQRDLEHWTPDNVYTTQGPGVEGLDGGKFCQNLSCKFNIFLVQKDIGRM